jgi:hypothetical protein
MSGEDEDLPRVMATVIWSVPPLVLRLGTTYLKMRLDAKRAGQLFYRELIDGGMPKEAAQELRDEYVSTLDIRRLMKEMGGFDLFGRR